MLMGLIKARMHVIQGAKVLIPEKAVGTILLRIFLKYQHACACSTYKHIIAMHECMCIYSTVERSILDYTNRGDIFF